jgi:4-oxalocrotonate tautomerase
LANAGVPRSNDRANHYIFCTGWIQFLNWPHKSGRAISGLLMGSDPKQAKPRKETVMPLVDIHLIEGVFDKNQKQAMINKVTNAMVEVEGEAMRGVTWVRVYEVASGEWAIGGKALSAADVKAMQTRA